MKIWTPLLLCLISCGSKEKDVANTEPESIQEEIQAPIQTEQENNQSITAENFPLYWEMLTEEEGEFIIFRPCDAANFCVSINDKRTVLSIEYGQDGALFDILSIDHKSKLSSNGNKDFLLFRIRDQNAGTEKRVFEVNAEFNQDTRHVFWTGLPYRDEEIMMISSLDTSYYKTVIQPCSDCWDECE